DYYNPQAEISIAWNDPQLSIDWPTKEIPMLSKKDNCGVLLSKLGGM
ncbi:dTDP-4-dehydrorhamnose 3,5-epimerase family protein, partial [Vibrio sp. 10N.222.52.C3]